MFYIKSTNALIAASWFLSSFLTAAESTNPKAPAVPGVSMSPELREDMAQAHEKMASCLRSKKPFEECQAEMMASCQKSMGQGACPMMGAGMMHGPGKGNGPMRPR